ncbi:MAG: dimethylsulfonioproprionate lyase family protein [Gammaproteobacteria bacterium]
MSAAESPIAALVVAADAYLARCPGEGVSAVRAGIAAAHGPVAPCVAPNAVCDAHLAAALDALRPQEPALALAIANAAACLPWITYDLYDPAKIGESFRTGHAFAQLLHAEDFDLGLFLIAPNVLYRDHAHPAPELYAPLTGPHGWRFGPGGPLEIRPAHQPVWNPPHHPHLTKVGPLPFLAFYGWTRDVDAPAYVLPADDWGMLEALRL